MVGRGQGRCGHWSQARAVPAGPPPRDSTQIRLPSSQTTGGGVHPGPTALPHGSRDAARPGRTSAGERGRPPPPPCRHPICLCVHVRASLRLVAHVCACVYMGGTKPGLPAWTRASLLPARPHQVTKALESEGKQLGLPALGDHYLPWEKPASRAEAVVPFTSGKKPIPVPTGPGPPRDNGDDRPRGRERRASWEGRCGHQKAMERSPGGPSVHSCRAPVPDALSWGWCAAPTPREDREGGGLLHGHGRPPRTRRGSHGHPAALPRGLAGPGSQDSAHQPLEGAPTPHGSHSRP